MKKYKLYWKKAKRLAWKAGDLGERINSRFANYLKVDKRNTMKYKFKGI